MTLDLPIAEPVVLALTFVRVMGVLLLAPVFAHAAISMRIRGMLALVAALLVAPVAGPAPPADGLALAVVAELLTGLAIGFVAALVLAPIGFMAELASLQGGLGAASVIDPSSDAPSLVLANLLRLSAMLLFLAIGAHHEVIRALWLSFERIPIGTGLAATALGEVGSLGAVVFEAGFRLAAPLTVVLVVSNLVVGALGRTIPQLNLMSMQLPAQIALTLAILALGAGAFFDAMSAEIGSLLERGLGAALGGA